MASIAAKLNKIKKMTAHAHDLAGSAQLSSPLAAEKESVRQTIEHSENYCTNVMKHKSTFSNLTNHQLKLVAQHVDQVMFKLGDRLMTEGEPAGECFIIESGTLSATAVQPTGKIKEIEKLTPGSMIGEMCFILDEPRPYTVTVTSDICKAFKLTKKIFQEVVDSTTTTITRDREKLAKDVISKVKIFQKLTAENKAQLLQAMTPVVFQDGNYICKQGKLGKGFFVITDGKCMVSLNMKGGGERDIRLLEVGDYFGEIALLANSNKSTANVVARDVVSCMALGKTDFHLLLHSIEEDIKRSNELKGIKHQEDFASASTAKKEANAVMHRQLFYRRRITGVDIHNCRSENRIDSILRRMAKYMVESLWNSMYSRMYRHLLLLQGMHPEALAHFGSYAVEIMNECVALHRLEGVLKIQEKCRQILSLTTSERAVPVNRNAENADDQDPHARLISGMVQLTNQFKDKLCDHWCQLQFDQVARKFKLQRHGALTKIIGFQDELHNIYLILRGSVRIYQQQRFRGVYHEDLFVGEIFGDAGIEDRSAKGVLAQAITDCDLAVISIDDYMWINNATTHAKATMDIPARFKFLSKIPILQDLLPNRLLKIATAMKQIHLNKDTQVMYRGQQLSDFHILISGTINLLTSAEDAHDNTAIITVLQKNEHYGLSGPLTSLCNVSPPLVETLDAVTACSCEILVLPGNIAFLLDDSIDCLSRLKTHFMTKRAWRLERYEALMASRERMAKVLHVPVKTTMTLTTEDVFLHQGVEKNSNASDRTLDNIRVSEVKHKTHLHQLNDAAAIEAFNVVQSTPTQRSLALHTKLGAVKDGVTLVHDEREFVLNLTQQEQEALHSSRVPSSIARELPPVHTPHSVSVAGSRRHSSEHGGHAGGGDRPLVFPGGHSSRGHGGNDSGSGPRKPTSSLMDLRDPNSTGNHSTNSEPSSEHHHQHSPHRLSHHYIADHRRGSSGHV